jgi:hypothetical protein
MTDEDYTAIEAADDAFERGVSAVGNFTLTVVPLQRSAGMAAREFVIGDEIIFGLHLTIDSACQIGTSSTL